MTLVDQLRPALAALGHSPTPSDVVAALRAGGHMVTDAGVATIVGQLRRESTGAGVLDGLLRLPGVTDVVVNGPDAVYVDCGAGFERAAVRFDSDEQVRELAVRLAAKVGRRLDDGQPFVDARLADGVRVHAVLGGVGYPGTCLSLRVPSRGSVSVDEWVESGLAAQGAELLRAMVESKVAFLVSGGTGSGKTTLLASLLELVGVRERIVIVEDSRELTLRHPHAVSLEGRPANAEGAGQITMAALVRQALRMRPDRLVVGEVRGAEVVDMLGALNTGHEGGCATIHANSALDVLPRLEALGALAGLPREALLAQAGAGLQAVIHVRRVGVRRVVEEVFVVEREPEVRLRCAFHLRDGYRPGPGAAKLESLL